MCNIKAIFYPFSKPDPIQPEKEDIESQEVEEKSLLTKGVDFVKGHPVEISLALVALAGVSALVYFSHFHGVAPSPVVDFPSNVDLSPEISSGNGQSPITVFTSYTADNPDRLVLSRKVAEVQRAYCERQGYDYLVFEKNLADSWYAKTLPYWSKVAGMNQLLNRADLAEKQWFVWLDDDIVVTNLHVRFEDIISKVSKTASFILTEDAASSYRADVPLNTGFLLVKNDDNSRMLFQRLWDMRFQSVRFGTYANCPAQSCLHEQQALTDLLEYIKPQWNRFVEIIPQRFLDGIGVNTFARENHYDVARNMYLNYDADPIDTRWKVGDFLGHCTGLALNGRLKNQINVQNLRERCVNQLISQSL